MILVVRKRKEKTTPFAIDSEKCRIIPGCPKDSVVTYCIVRLVL